jgi:hypothetical protein
MFRLAESSGRGWRSCPGPTSLCGLTSNRPDRDPHERADLEQLETDGGAIGLGCIEALREFG